MSEGAEYINHGWSLCQFASGSKGDSSMTKGWNTFDRAIRDVSGLVAGKNIGLLHAWSSTCALDCDDYMNAREWLTQRGIDLDSMLASDVCVQIKSGRPNRAKMLFRIPAGIKPLQLRSIQVKAPSPDADGKHAVWFELRCATESGDKSVQDVLPPSIHPDTGKPYTWAGDWRQIPELPASVLAVWLSLIDETPKERKQRGATGPGTSAEVLDFSRRLATAGLKPYRCGDGFRSYCPHHGGESGTTFKLDEGASGQALWHCKAGCEQKQVIDDLERLAPRDRAVASVSKISQQKSAEDAIRAGKSTTGGAVLPDFPQDLLRLPHGLGQLQDWILGYMTYPSAASAGLTAIAVLSHFGMVGVSIDSRRGLGLNEQYLVLAPTGFGKEDLRAPFEILAEAITTRRPANVGNLWPHNLPRIQHSAPGTAQALQKLLEEHHAQTCLADEFAEWLGHAASDSHRQQALGHFMQAYSKALGTLSVPAAVTNTYQPVKNPRIIVFATSTAERILETFSASQADSGALNRFVILVAEQDRVGKRYDVTAAQFVPPNSLVDLVAWVSSLSGVVVTMDADARSMYESHDARVLDPLKFSDNRLAGRLNEQAFKIAALVAISDRRLVIGSRDLAIAYAVREGLYHRTAALIGFDGALSGMHGTGRALEQIKQRLLAKPFLYRSNLPKESRQFSKLSLPERESVMRAVQAEGYARLDGGRFVSLICQEIAQ